MAKDPLFKRVAILVSVAGLIALVQIYLLTRHPGPPKVPLGVEQAAIITFSGPKLAVAPYKWGVAVNVRIAQATEEPDRRIYDVRYFVNRAGTFDLKDYLVAEDGSALHALPSFRFQGDPKRSKSLDTRIRETENVRIDVGGHYYEILTVLGLLWMVWLLLLIFFQRPRNKPEAPTGPAAPTLAEMLRHLLAQLEAGDLNTAGKAHMEMLLLRCWRQELALGPVPMKTAMNAIRQDEHTGVLLRTLQTWLHHPSATVPREEIASIIATCANHAEPPEESEP